MVDGFLTAFAPDFGVFPLGVWVRLSTTTLAMSLLAVIGTGLLGLALSFPSGSNFLLPGWLLGAGGQRTPYLLIKDR